MDEFTLSGELYSERVERKLDSLISILLAHVIMFK